MGQWAYFREISPRLLARLVQDPSLVLAVKALHQRDLASMAEALPEQARERTKAVLQSFQSLKDLDIFAGERERERSGLETLRNEGFEEADSPSQIDIEKRWRYLSEVLDTQDTPNATKLGYIVVGGTEIGEDLGYGPLRYFTPEDVTRITEFLRALDRDSLRQRLEASSCGNDELEYVSGALDAVRDYYASAAAKSYGMLLFFG